MRIALALLLMLVPVFAPAQSRTVQPSELALTVTVEETEHDPLTREMVLITIRGVYRRHITREKLVQPDLEGFSWTQLGTDLWREERIDGKTVKTFTRRMAVFPDRAGTLTIGAFTHNLTLTDEGDNWFEHQVRSEPVTIEVDPAPGGTEWWFPVRRLTVADEWSNAPDQLAPGEGVLRIIRIEALGATPEMLPPMPALTSPSAMIFAHPEKRFVELSPRGPVAIAFWRWTIRPTNGTSAIVEPLSFDYFDTTLREARTVTISAQRVAYGSVVPDALPRTSEALLTRSHDMPRGLLVLVAAVVFSGGVLLAQGGHRWTGMRALQRFALLDPLALQLRRAARAGDPAAMRRAAAALLRRDGETAERTALLRALDARLFSRTPPGGEPRHDIASQFLRGSKVSQPIRD